ncbi:hypothetical protein [Streptomyces acidiscabies]|uniref:hypothetical protein n=1 Tax=Streptomyces acidiscabies TaxID=42234 RepID=UPI00095B6890|nr:hypothetical protein [Streptomyces acidiscabies]GAV43498.1 hypothetical protein Saa2_06450 [Streptomyces acidiscabies]
MRDVAFGLEGLFPADPPSLQARRTMWEGDLDLFASHSETRGPGRDITFLLAHDRSATWGIPGAPALRSLIIERNQYAGLYLFSVAPHSLTALGQAWLIARGCPREPILRLPDGLLEPADDATRALEEQLWSSGDGLAVHDSWSDLPATWMIVQDPAAEVLPVRVLLEVPDYDAGTYTLTEGAFVSVADAREWLEGDRDTPMPQPPGPGFTERRARAASARSPHTPDPAAGPCRERPPAGPDASGGPGRSR